MSHYSLSVSSGAFNTSCQVCFYYSRMNTLELPCSSFELPSYAFFFGSKRFLATRLRLSGMLVHHRFRNRVGGIRRRESDAMTGRKRVSEECEEESTEGIRGMRRGEPSGYQRNAKRAKVSSLAAALLGLVLYFPLPGGSACSFVAVQPPAAQPPGRPLFLKSLQPRLVHARLRGGQGDNTTSPWKREDDPPSLYTNKIRGLDDDWCEINFELFRSFLLCFSFLKDYFGVVLGIAIGTGA